MFADFDDVFNNKAEVQTEIPDVLLELFNHLAPRGTHYIIENDRSFHLEPASENEALHIGGFIFENESEYRKVLGKSYSLENVFRYMYNAQQSIAIKPSYNDMLEVNGENIPINKLFFNPLAKNSYVKGSGKFLLLPKPFPAPHEVIIGNKDFRKTLLIQRVANKSLNELTFESVNDSSIRIKFYFNEKLKKTKLNIKLQLEFSNTVQEYVETFSICNSIIDGTVRFNGLALGVMKFDRKISDYNQESLTFWLKVLQVEKLLNTCFYPSKHKITHSVVTDIEELYQTLINGNPIRQNTKITELVGKDASNLETVIQTIGKPIYFQFSGSSKYDVLGAQIIVPCIIGVFNAIVVSCEQSNDGYKIILDDESEDKESYITILNLLNEQGSDMLSGMTNESINSLRMAKNIREYISVSS